MLSDSQHAPLGLGRRGADRRRPLRRHLRHDAREGSRPLPSRPHPGRARDEEIAGARESAVRHHRRLPQTAVPGQEPGRAQGCAGQHRSHPQNSQADPEEDEGRQRARQTSSVQGRGREGPHKGHADSTQSHPDQARTQRSLRSVTSSEDFSIALASCDFISDTCLIPQNW